MTVLVDTPIIVDHLRNDSRAVRLLTELFDVLAWVETDVTVADAAGELAREYRRSHSSIDTTDYLIAAAARSIGARLITLNVWHYPMFEGLEPAYR